MKDTQFATITGSRGAAKRSSSRVSSSLSPGAAPMCTGTGSVGVETRADTVSAPGTVDDWEAEGGAVPGVTPLDLRSAPQAPAGPWEPKGERWDFRMVRDVLTRHGYREGDLGIADGWTIGPNMWDVMMMRVQGRDVFRPHGRARDAWDDAMRAYGTALETETGMTVVRRNAHCIVVNVDVPAGLRVTARVRRVGPLDDFTTTVTFDGYDGIGGTVVFDGVLWPHWNGFGWPHFWAVWVTGQGGVEEERSEVAPPLDRVTFRGRPGTEAVRCGWWSAAAGSVWSTEPARLLPLTGMRTGGRLVGARPWARSRRDSQPEDRLLVSSS
ncbi:hypothetical protein [Streptomyces sp. NPDC085466]|uniref:hypothetical protein n=1 Tax=Streptomyces sp. NPDC085466 TaxID=3365725 RepID=UPI0037CCDF94